MKRAESQKQPESESDFLSWVIDCARVYGWLVHHTRPAWTGKGWRTPIQGDKGCPDLLLARNGVVLLRELKLDGKRPTISQEVWLEASGGEVWRPSQREEIERVLR